MVRALVASGGASTTLASSIVYQPFGPLAALTQGNGLSLNRAYDGNYWLSGVTLSGSAGTLLGLAITRDANGKVTAVSDSTAPLRNASYSYTDAGRLAAANGTWGADSYSWDANDNRTRADRTLGGIGSGSTASDVATLAPGTNRLAELKDGAGVVSRSFAHTPGGDTATITRPAAPTLAYSYDARGRLSSVMSGAAQIASYAYDWREQRVSASSTEVGARHYLYADDGQLLAEHDAATGALLREYVWLDAMPLAMVSGAAATPTYTWITTGNLNEPLLLTNAAGQVTASTTRDPWGNPILLAGGEPLDLGYPGQWRDASTGLSQNWHRDYDPTLGRYVEADPLGLGGGSNLFAYVGGDPVNAVDPTGKIPLVALVGAVFVAELAWQGYQLWREKRDWTNWRCYNFLEAGLWAATAPIGGELWPPTLRLTAGSMRFSNISKRLRRAHDLFRKPIDLHHAIFPRRWENLFGSPRWLQRIVNHPLNLKAIPRPLHRSIHRGNPIDWLRGVPEWIQLTAITPLIGATIESVKKSTEE